MQSYNQKLIINSRTFRSEMTGAEQLLWKRIVRQMQSEMLR
jgi:very-short-patch-repair endonuclease